MIFGGLFWVVAGFMSLTSASAYLFRAYRNRRRPENRSARRLAENLSQRQRPFRWAPGAPGMKAPTMRRNDDPDDRFPTPSFETKACDCGCGGSCGGGGV